MANEILFEINIKALKHEALGVNSNHSMVKILKMPLITPAQLSNVIMKCINFSGPELGP